jgi:LGFP repeat
VLRILGRSPSKGAGRTQPLRTGGRELDPGDIEVLHPRESARHVRQMEPDAAVRVLSPAPAASAGLLKVLLAEDEALTVRILAHARKAPELIEAMTSPPECLKELPAAIADIDRCEQQVRGRLGQVEDLLTRLAPPRAGTRGFRRTFGPRPRDVGETAGPGLAAAIYWSPRHGAYPVWGRIGELYEAEGGAGDWLGFPRSGEIPAGPSQRDDGGTTGVYQKFDGGAVWYSDKTGAIAVPALVDGHHRYDHRGPASGLGFPVSPLMQAGGQSPDAAEGHYQRFEGKWDYPEDILRCWTGRESPRGATIYTSPAHGTYCVGWGNGILYKRLGGTSSWLGFPVSDSRTHHSETGEYHVQEFEGGVIIWCKAQGSVAVPKATLNYLDSQAGLRDHLGLPLRRPDGSAADEQVQFFENGVVILRDGTVEAWIRAAILRGPAA